MRHLLLLLLPIISLLAACHTKKLAQRLPGTWYIDHYDEYALAADQSTGHDLDGAGYMSFSKSGRAGRRLKTNHPHGALTQYAAYSWQLKDSLVSISDAQGRPVEEWYISKDLTDYMEWVSVNGARDSVRTMYLRK